jgi:hypothetical protein
MESYFSKKIILENICQTWHVPNWFFQIYLVIWWTSVEPTSSTTVPQGQVWHLGAE